MICVVTEFCMAILTKNVYGHFAQPNSAIIAVLMQVIQEYFFTRYQNKKFNIQTIRIIYLFSFIVFILCE